MAFLYLFLSYCSNPNPKRSQWPVQAPCTLTASSAFTCSPTQLPHMHLVVLEHTKHTRHGKCTALLLPRILCPRTSVAHGLCTSRLRGWPVSRPSVDTTICNICFSFWRTRLCWNMLQETHLSLTCPVCLSHSFLNAHHGLDNCQETEILSVGVPTGSQIDRIGVWLLSEFIIAIDLRDVAHPTIKISQ